MVTSVRHFLFGLLVATSTLIAIAPVAYAAEPAEETAPTSLKTVEDEAKKSGYRLAFATCLRDRLGNFNTTISPSDISAGKIIGDTILGSNQVNVGALIRPNSDDHTGEYMCGELNPKIDEMKALFGQQNTSRLEFFCSTKAIKRLNNSPCVSGDGDLGHDNSFDNAKANINGGKGYTGPQLYLTAYNALVGNGCKLRDPVLDANANVDIKNTKQKVSIVNSTGRVNTVWYTVNLTQNFGVGGYFAYPYVQQEDASNTNLNCIELIGEMNKNASAYGAIVMTAPDADKTVDDTGGNTPGNGTPDPSVPTCTVENIGWIVCPVTNFLGNIADGAVGILNSFFEVPATALFDTNGPAYKYWQQVRNYANIMFVIAFLIIIFSQVTSVGITNYGIKKLLPKLIATALLVNLSFPICALLVDTSNLLGYGLSSLIGNDIAKGTGDAAKAWDIVKDTDGATPFGGIVAAALTLTATVGALYFALAAVVGVLVSVVVIGVTMVMLLGIRQALIILLVVLSPLAFVALLLPNTEPLFKKWLKLFKSMLLIFPIASLLYGAGKLASTILQTSSDNMIVQVIGAALPVVMLVAIYKVFTSAMNAIDGVGAFTNGLRNGLNKMGDPFKNLAASRQKKVRDNFGNHFMAGNVPGLKNVGRFMGQRQAKWDARLDSSKSQLDAMKAGYTKNNLQKYTNQSAAAKQQTQNAQQAIKNQGMSHLLNNNPALYEEEGKLKEEERKLENEKETVKIDASHLERSLADVAEQIKKNAESSSANESKSSMQGSRPDLIAKEGELQQTARRLDNVSKIIQASDDATTKEFLAANQSGENLKEAEAGRDATWKETVAGSEDLTQQQVRIQGQEARGKAADEAVNTTVKREMAEGTMQIHDGQGGDVSLGTIREREQNAKEEAKVYDAAIKGQDNQRLATDPHLKDLRNLTTEAEMTSQVAENDIQAQSDEFKATDADAKLLENQIRAQQDRAAGAKRVQTTNYADALNRTGSPLLTTAGGIAPGGEHRVLAQAKATISREYDEAVKNQRTTYASLGTSGDKGALEKIITHPTSSTEEREAASAEYAKLVGEGDIIDRLNESRTIKDPQKRKAVQQGLLTGMKDSGKALAYIPGPVRGAIERGEYTDVKPDGTPWTIDGTTLPNTHEGFIVQNARFGKTTADTFAAMSEPERAATVKALSTHTGDLDAKAIATIQSTINDLLDPSLKPGLKVEQRVVDNAHELAAALAGKGIAITIPSVANLRMHS